MLPNSRALVMFRRTKRQRLEHPTCWMDCESIAAVPMPYLEPEFILKSQVATVVTKEIIFDRIRKEIVEPFRYSLSSKMKILEGESLEGVKARRSWLRKRIICGTNAVARVLEAAVNCKEKSAPLLLLLMIDAHPSLMSHLPILAQQCRVPLLLLPGTSVELGKMMGTKKVAALAFVPHHAVFKVPNDESRVHAAVDSLVEFVRGKIDTK